MPGQYSPTGPKNPYNPTGQRSGMQNLNNIASPFEKPEIIARGQYSKNAFDTKILQGAANVTEQFKGLPPTGFAPGSSPAVGGGISFQQRLRLMFVKLVESGMSHKDAAIHIQKSTGFHARTGQKLTAKTVFTKEKKIKYAGQFLSTKHYRTPSRVRRARRPGSFPATPAGLK